MILTIKHKAWDDLSPAKKVARAEGVLRVLRGLTPSQRKNNFDMGVYLEKRPGCGTVGCAAGFCGLDEKFRRQGFGLKLVKVKVETLDDDDQPTGQFLTYWSDEFTGYSPADFFGPDLYNYVFMATHEDYAGTVRNVKEVIADLKAAERAGTL